jgi:methionyl-tRNA formyltransferase
VQLIAEGNPQTQLQEESSELKTAHKLNKENCKIDWSQPGQSIHNLIRGLSPYPAAWCHLINNNQESTIKIYLAQFELEQHQLNVGTLIADKKTLKVAVCDGFVHLLQVQLPGKNKMMVSDLLNGFTVDHTARLY